MKEETTLGDLEGFDSSEKTYPALFGANMGHNTLKMNLSIQEVMDISRVYNALEVEQMGHLPHEKLDAQRPISESHAKSLAKYIVIGLVETNIRRARKKGVPVPQCILNLQCQLGKSEYSCLQPFVTNIRDCEPDGSDLKYERITEVTPSAREQILDGVIRVKLASKHIMSVVDGQHRRWAFDLVMKWLTSINNNRRYPVNGVFNPKDTMSHGEYIDTEVYSFWAEILDIAVKESFVVVECHLGASAIQERQIFSDLNSKGKKVDLSQSLEYDTSDAVNSFIKDELLGGQVIKFDTKLKDSANWQDDDGMLLRKDLNPITSLAMWGKVATKEITPAMVLEHRGIPILLWKSVQKVAGFGKPKARLKTVAAQSVVLKGIARLAFDLAYGNKGMKNPVHLKELWSAIGDGSLDLSHKNPAWRSLMLSNVAREKLLPGVSSYVHVPVGTNLDAGTFDEVNQWVRYGAKHNDIYPRIGDLIRYQLSFDPRPSVTRAIEKEREAK